MKTISDARELAKSVIDGKPSDNCPIEFSYVNAAIWLAHFVQEFHPITIADDARQRLMAFQAAHKD